MNDISNYENSILAISESHQRRDDELLKSIIQNVSGLSLDHKNEEERLNRIAIT